MQRGIAALEWTFDNFRDIQRLRGEYFLIPLVERRTEQRRCSRSWTTLATRWGHTSRSRKPLASGGWASRRTSLTISSRGRGASGATPGPARGSSPRTGRTGSPLSETLRGGSVGGARVAALRAPAPQGHPTQRLGHAVSAGAARDPPRRRVGWAPATSRHNGSPLAMELLGPLLGQSWTTQARPVRPVHDPQCKDKHDRHSWC